MQYEIPDRLKKLYKHWEYHTILPVAQSTNTETQQVKKTLDTVTLNEMQYFIRERMRIWQNKQASTFPLTSDPILSQYRFCNVYRELDRQTIALHDTLSHLRDDFTLWLLNMLFCRMVCRPETISYVGLLSLSHSKNDQVFKKLEQMSRPKYGTAYVFPISVIQKSDFPTRELFFTRYLPQVIEDCSVKLVSQKRVSVVHALNEVISVFGYNFFFHWTEVLIDVAYQFPEYIDLYKEFPIGPGSAPTLKLLSPNNDPVNTCTMLPQVKIDQNDLLHWNGKPVYLSTENWEGIGCETRKYRNIKSGGGRVRKYS